MSIEQTLTELLELGIGPITIGKPPKNSAPPGQVPEFFIVADHNIPTGSFGNSMQTKHQTVGKTIGETLSAFADQVKEFKTLEVKPSEMIAVPRNSSLQ